MQSKQYIISKYNLLCGLPKADCIHRCKRIGFSAKVKIILLTYYVYSIPFIIPIWRSYQKVAKISKKIFYKLCNHFLFLVEINRNWYCILNENLSHISKIFLIEYKRFFGSKKNFIWKIYTGLQQSIS